MKLIIEPLFKTQRLSVETKLGIIPMRRFLSIALTKDGRSKYHIRASANVDVSDYYRLLNGRGKGDALRSTLLLLDELGYDLMLVKREK